MLGAPGNTGTPRITATSAGATTLGVQGATLPRMDLATVTDQLLPFATGCMTLVAMWLAGSRRALGWAVGLANQGLWLAFIVSFEAWGLLPLTVALTVVYARNLHRWRTTTPAPASDERPPVTLSDEERRRISLPPRE